MSNADRAREAMADVLAKVRQLRSRPVVPAASQPAVAQPENEPSLEALLRSYRELAALAVKLERRIDAEDPLYAEVQAGLRQARQAWGAMLFDDSAGVSQSPEPSGSATFNEAVASRPEPSPSVELVHKPRTQSVVPATRRLPDEATLVRYFRRRRERRRLPDESVIGRRLRERRERGPRYPDEAAIARYRRMRRERW